MRAGFTEAQAREAILGARSYSEALRSLGLRPAGGNHQTLKKYARLWGIPTDHFTPASERIRFARAARKSLSEVMVEGSTYHRGHLKRRLLAEGLKQPVCEMCGQGEIWNGRRMSLILDHTNGVANDHRLENLRIVCPNCAATLDTHCGKNNRRVSPRNCAVCGEAFYPTGRYQRQCGRRCGGRSEAQTAAHRALRRVERPPYEQLLEEVARFGYRATGRRYGVSDNAIRKWIRFYEREREGPDTDELRVA